MMHKLKRSCIIVLTSFVTFYVGVMVVLSFLENSMVYFPAPWTKFDDLAPNDTLKDHFHQCRWQQASCFSARN